MFNNLNQIKSLFISVRRIINKLVKSMALYYFYMYNKLILDVQFFIQFFI